MKLEIKFEFLDWLTCSLPFWILNEIFGAENTKINFDFQNSAVGLLFSE